MLLGVVIESNDSLLQCGNYLNISGHTNTSPSISLMQALKRSAPQVNFICEKVKNYNDGEFSEDSLRKADPTMAILRGA